ncbi:hypothetical protein LP419_16105 [Massilia sp. H-1]|nr:hypothetical protein LP419_16105 [Massilia sp. H-1]
MAVNLGMFHYHFKNKDNFIRAVLQRLYEAMFADLQLQADAGADALSGLRAAFTVLGGFRARTASCCSCWYRKPCAARRCRSSSCARTCRATWR